MTQLAQFCTVNWVLKEFQLQPRKKTEIIFDFFSRIKTEFCPSDNLTGGGPDQQTGGEDGPDQPLGGDWKEEVQI